MSMVRRGRDVFAPSSANMKPSTSSLMHLPVPDHERMFNKLAQCSLTGWSYRHYKSILDELSYWITGLRPQR